MGVKEGFFVGNKVLGEKVSPRDDGMCVVGVNEGGKILGRFVGLYVGMRVVGIRVGGREGFFVGNKVLGEKVSPRDVGNVVGVNECEKVFGIFVGLYVGSTHV